MNDMYSISKIEPVHEVESFLVAINDSSMVLGYFESSQDGYGEQQGFIWQEGKTTSLGNMYPRSINNSGEVAGYMLDLKTGFYYACIHRGSGIERAEVDKTVSSFGMQINDSSQMLIHSIDTRKLHVNNSKLSGSQAYVYHGGNTNWIRVSDQCRLGKPIAINNQCKVVGYIEHDENLLVPRTEAILWTGTETIHLGRTIIADDSEAVAINNNGIVLCHATSNRSTETIQMTLLKKLQRISLSSALPTTKEVTERMVEWIEKMTRDRLGSYRTNAPLQSFIWKNGNEHTLKPFEAGDISSNVIAASINDKGQVVGAIETPGKGSIACLWYDGETCNLNRMIQSNGWFLENAISINNQGQIIGSGIHEGNKSLFILS